MNTGDQLDLARPGVIWRAGMAHPIEPTGTGRSIANLRDGRLVVGGGGRANVLAAIDRVRWECRDPAQ